MASADPRPTLDDAPVDAQLGRMTDLDGLGLIVADLVAGTAVAESRAADLFGVPFDVPLTRDVIQACYHPDDRNRVAEQMQAALDPDGDGTALADMRVVRSDGSTVWLSTRTRIVFEDAEGGRRPVRAVLVASDVTAAHAAAAHSRADPQIALDAAQLGHWHVDVASGTVFRDARAETLHGLPATDATHGLSGLQGGPRGRPRPRQRAVGADGAVRWLAVTGRAVGAGHIAGVVRDVTERKEGELALARSRRRLQLALLVARLGTFESDPASDEHAADGRAREILGLDADEPLSAFAARVHPDDRAAFDRFTVGASRPAPLPSRAEYRLHMPGGDVRWIEGAAWARDDGRGVSVVGTVRDVTARREAAAEIARGEARYRLVLDSVDVGFCLLDVLYDDDGAAVAYRFVETNPAFEQQTGLADVAGKNAYEPHPGARAAVVRGVCRRGRLRRAGPLYQPLRGDGPLVRRLRRARRRAGQRARGRALHRRQRAAPHPGRAARERDAGPAHARRAAHLRRHLLARWDRRVHQPPRARRPRRRPRGRRRAAVPRDRLVGRRPADAGARRAVEFGAFPLFDADGAVSHVVVSGYDVTDRARAEAALRALTGALEDRVAARTAELERSNAELDLFAYVASHDLKAPIRAIDSLASWIAEDAAAALPPESVRHLALLRGRAERMERLLGSLLAYSRAGRQEADARAVDTAALVREAVAVVAPPEGFDVRVEGGFPTVVTARAPLELVVRNLVANAIKHHRRPDGRVTVSARTLGGWAEFTVADDGPGVAEAYRERVFGMFQTLRPRDEVEGSGMGLAIVRKTVEARGGRITLGERPGGGASFRFTWPLTP